MSWLDSIFTAASVNAAQLQSVAVAATPPTLNQVLAFNGTLWTPSTPAAGGSNATQLQGFALSATTPLVNQVIAYNGSSWVPTNPSGSNATTLQGYAISAAPPTSGYFLQWNGTNYAVAPVTANTINGLSYPSSAGVAVGSIPYVSAANTGSYLTAGAAGTVFVGNGTAAAPSWSTSLSLSSGNVTLSGTLAIQGGVSSFILGSSAYTSQVVLQSAPGAPIQFYNGSAASLSVSRATNAVSWLADAAASSLTIGFTPAASGTGAGFVLAGQDSTSAGGRGSSSSIRGGNGDAGGGGGLIIQAGSSVSGGGSGALLQLAGGGGNGAGASGGVFLSPGPVGTGPAGQVTIQALAYSPGAVSVAAAAATLTLSNTQYVNPQLAFSGAMTNDTVVVAPLVNGLAFNLYNGGTGPYALTFGGASGLTVYLPRGQWIEVTCDGTNYYASSRVVEIVVALSLINAAGTTNTALVKLPPNFVLTLANVRTTTALVGGTTTLSLGTASGGITILKALAPPAVAALPLGVNTGDLGTDMLSTSGFQAYYAAAATIYGTQVQSGAACTAGVIEIYLAGYVP